MPCAGTPASVVITTPNGGIYTLTATPDFTGGNTTICYTLSNDSPEGTQASGVSHIDIALCPELTCPAPPPGGPFEACCAAIPPFTITDNGNTIPTCGPGVMGDCVEFPVPVPTAAGTNCGFRINFDPSIEIGESRTFCINFSGILTVVPAPFRLVTGEGSVSEDANCLVLSISCVAPTTTTTTT
ncbi:MAG TPA: hypothetical protein VD902_22370, partial [Symbiobacteriaceae bacterium]|nr:hypothetical protein [Symbiobacteriaceae bacterium]